MHYMVASGAVILFLDQATKRLAAARLSGRPLAIGAIVTLRPVMSRRVRYERALPRMLLAALWIASAVSSLILAQQGDGFSSRAAQIAVGAAIGGAAGNLIDILRRRSVRDFIDLGWWPVFNIADVAIIAGLAFAFIPGLTK